MRLDSQPTMLVILPKFAGHYLEKEVFGLVPGFRTIFAAGERELGEPWETNPERVTLNYFHGVGAVGDSVGLLARARNLDQLIESTTPRVVVTFELHSLITHQVECCRDRVRFKHVVQTYETAGPGRGLWSLFPPTRVLGCLNVDGPDLFIAPSILSRDVLVSMGVASSRVLLLPLGVFPEVFKPALESPKEDPAVVLYVGALRENKGLRALISGLDLVWRDRTSDRRLVMAGAGPLTDWVRAQAQTHHWIRFEGKVSQEEKVKLLGGATVFVYPSEDIRFLGRVRWEEQGAMSVLEAMMSGLPVVATDCGAMKELIPAENPIVPQRSPRELGTAIESLLSDRERVGRCRLVNRERAVARFDIHGSARALGVALQVRGM